MKRSVLLAAGIGVASITTAGVALAQASPNGADSGPAPAVLSRPRTAADALAPELVSVGARKNGPVVAETRLVHQVAGRSIWLAPANTGGVCVLVMMRSGAASAGGANCVTFADLKTGPVFRVHTDIGSVDLALAADGAADAVAGRLSGQVATPNVVFVPTAPMPE
jgi:hypothetical protein